MGMPIPPVVTPNVVPPIITVNPSFTIGGSNITYDQFLNSLGKYNYGAEFFYVASDNYAQIGQPYYYNRFDANGNQVAVSLPFAVDPYQSQPSIFYETESDQIIFTGLSSFSFLIFAGSLMYFKFFSTITYLGNELDDKKDNTGDNTFEEIEQIEGVKFFDDYCNYLID